jgi:hypothetical protein
MTSGTSVPHAYISTACQHGRHDYCESRDGAVGAKVPRRCKFCPATCLCPAHTDPAADCIGEDRRHSPK